MSSHSTRKALSQKQKTRPDKVRTASRQPLAFKQLTRTPLVPEAVLKRHGAYCAIDTRFRAATRLQQALWLKGQNIETALNELSNPRSFSGSILSSSAARAGKNFLNIDIHRLAVDAMLFCEDQAIFDPMRATQNALTSMALAFNLFGPLALNLELATAVFQKLFPDVQSVQGIIWEHAPARRGAFAPLTLETVIEALAAAGASDLAQALWGRYCDLDQVYRLSMQEFASDPIEAPSPPSANNSSADTPALPRTRRRMSSSRRGNIAPTTEHQAAAETNVLDAKVEVGAP